MPSSWVPTKLSTFVTFASNFVGLIVANPSLYGLTAGDANALSIAEASFIAAYALSNAKATRNAITIADTQAAKNAAVVLFRAYGRIVKASQGVSDGDKTALGIVLTTYQPSAIPAPATMPLISINGGTPQQLTCTYRDQNSTPKSRAKPAGTVALEMRVSTSIVVISDPDSLMFDGIYTRTPFALNFASGDRGKTAYIAGRWLNRKGQWGPWSAIQTAIVP
ncbi:MAG: hypothetical protein WB347_21325 [Terriglobales bacterium]